MNIHNWKDSLMWIKKMLYARMKYWGEHRNLTKNKMATIMIWFLIEKNKKIMFCSFHFFRDLENYTF